jgi:hypothetical protein
LSYRPPRNPPSGTRVGEALASMSTPKQFTA